MTYIAIGTFTIPLPKGQLQRKYELVSNERAFKMLKIGTCMTEIGQAIHFKVDIMRQSQGIRVFLNVSIEPYSPSQRPASQSTSIPAASMAPGAM